MKKKSLEKKLNYILRGYYGWGIDDYYVGLAIRDILKVLPKTHFVHKCQDEIAELKMRNAQLKSVNKMLTDELYEFSVIKVQPKNNRRS